MEDGNKERCDDSRGVSSKYSASVLHISSLLNPQRDDNVQDNKCIAEWEDTHDSESPSSSPRSSSSNAFTTHTEKTSRHQETLECMEIIPASFVIKPTCFGDIRRKWGGKPLSSSNHPSSNRSSSIHPRRRRKTIGVQNRSQCAASDCQKVAFLPTQFCSAHGGGRRCQFGGCSKGARGSTGFCIAHGGGTRCKVPGCNTGARGSSGRCASHTVNSSGRCRSVRCNRKIKGSGDLCVECLRISARADADGVVGQAVGGGHPPPP